MIIQTGNLVYCLLGALWFLLIFVCWFLTKNRSCRSRRRFLFIYGLAVILLYLLYKGRLLQDTEYAAILGIADYGWIYELPLQPCNVMMLLCPAAVLSDNRRFRSFVFYGGFACTLGALLMPGAGFAGYSLLLPRVLGYYCYHWALLSEILLLVFLDLYRPAYSDVLPAAFFMLVCSFFVYLIDKMLRLTGIDPTANYWYVVDYSINSVFTFYHQLIPVEYLYIWLCETVLIPMFLLLAFIYRSFISLRKSDRNGGRKA